MAEIRIYNNFLKEDYLTLEYDASKSVLEQVQSLIDTDAYTKQLVECYDTETGETYYASLEDNVTDPSIIITVNNKDYTNEYIVKENDIICVYFLPLGENTPVGAIIGAILGVIAGIVLIATGVGAPLGGYSFAIGFSLIGGMVGLGSMIGMAIDMAINKPSVTKSITEKGKEGEQKPDIKGAENQSILGNVYPYVIGKHLVTPFIIGDPYTEYIGKRGEDAYIRAIYCVGYGPLKLTDFKLGDFYLAYNRPNKNSDRKTLLRGLLKGYSKNNFDDGDILDFWENNDVELEIIQHNPYDERYESVIYPEKIVQEEVNANILFISDKSLSETAKITYKNIAFPKNYRTNTVVFTESCPKEFEITLDAAGGLFATYTKTENDDDTSKTKTVYSSIPIYICAQWRPYNKNDEAPQSNGSDYSSWRNITTWNGVNCGITLNTGEMVHDIQSHQGNKLINGTMPTVAELEEIYGSFTNKIVSDIGKFSGEDGISQMRFTAKVTLSDEDIKLITSKDNTMKSIEVRVIRVSPCYIDEKKSTADEDGGESAQTYSDIIKFHSIKTKCFDEQEYRDTGKIVPIKVQTKEQYEKFCYIAIKAKADATGNIATQLKSLNCIAEAFSPIWDFENKKWLPENVQRTSSYVGFGKKVDELPENWDKTYFEYLVIEDGTFVFNTSPNFDFTQYKPSNGEKGSVRLEVSKEMYETCRQKGYNWIATKNGTNFTSKIKDIVYNEKIITKNGYTGNFLQEEGSKYNDSLSASAFMLSCVGPQCGPLALGYEQINLLSLGGWAEETVALKDGSLDENDNPIEIRMEANAYIHQGMKLEEILKSIALTGRAVFTYDETGKLLVIMDKPVKYPSGVISQQNCEDISVTYNYESLPAGLRIDFNDENDGYITNNFYCWSDGNSIKEYSGQVESYQIPYVTNPAQAWSLGRYFLACRILNKELVTAKLGPEGVNYNIGDVLALQSDELLIGDGSGRIQEIISDENLIYGIITDSVFSVKGSVTDINGTRISSEGVSIYQPKKFGKSRVITLRCAEVGYTVTIGDKEYVQIKGDTNVLLFENPIERDLSSDPSAKDIYSYNFDIGDVCLFGQYQKEYSRYKIIKIKPDKNNKYGVSLINYTDELYNYGAKLPTFQNNMTTIPVISDGINLSHLPDNVKDLAEFAKKDELNQYITGESVGAPSIPSFFASAEKDGIKIVIYPSANSVANIIKSYTAIITKQNGEEVSITATAVNLYYTFDRDIDGYLEAEDLSQWKVKLLATNIYGKSSDFTAERNVNTDAYGTWKLAAPKVLERVKDRSVTLDFRQPVRSDNREMYGDISYGITVMRPDIDEVFYTPNESSDPYSSETAYKIPDSFSPIFRNDIYVQIMPLKGQGSQNINHTQYKFRVVAKNEAETSEPTEISVTARATALDDFVNANATIKEAIVKDLSALSANLGEVSGSLYGDELNYWTLAEIVNGKHKRGAFRVGDENQGILVIPPYDKAEGIVNNTPNVRMVLKAGVFELSSTDSKINGELVVQKDKDSLYRACISPSGVFFEWRASVNDAWQEVTHQDISGTKTPSVQSDHSMIITNANMTQRRLNGSDIGVPIPVGASVYHFDTDKFDQHQKDTLTILESETGVQSVLKGSGDAADDAVKDFTPALLAIAPYSTVAKSLYGNFAIEKIIPKSQEWTIDFWLQFIWNESQTLFEITDDAQSIKLYMLNKEPYYNVPEDDEPPYNYETQMPNAVPYNEINTSSATLVHTSVSGVEQINLFNKGVKFQPNSWVHVGIVKNAEGLYVVIDKSIIKLKNTLDFVSDITLKLNPTKGLFLLDELMISPMKSVSCEDLVKNTTERIPYGSLDYREKHFVLDVNDSKVWTNFLTPTGTILSGLYTKAPSGFLFCDGSEVAITDYPQLYATIGELAICQSENEGYFKLPDLRETVLVGAGENTTLTIADHDVYELGEFKDDQVQDHTHSEKAPSGGWNTLDAGSIQAPTRGYTSDTTGGVKSGRSGTTTHGKQVGVSYIIKY